MKFSELDIHNFEKSYFNNPETNVDTNKTLVIKFDMFGRLKKNKIYKSIIKPGRSLYELYILGYHDAKNNHSYLQKYF